MQTIINRRILIPIAFLYFSISVTTAQTILIDDFENGYSKWKFEGDYDTFGKSPAKGNGLYQAKINGFGGKYLVNSAFDSGNAPIGKMKLRKPFLISRKYLIVSIGGGFNREKIYLRIIDTEGNELGRLTGRHSELLRKKSIDLSRYIGRSAFIEIVDEWDNPWWGHINVDDIYLSNSQDADVVLSTIEMDITHRYLNLPVKNKSTDNKFLEILDFSSEITGRLFYQEVLTLDFSDPDWVAALPVDSLIGHKVRLTVEHNIDEIPIIRQSDTIHYIIDYPNEIYRPQYFYSAGQGYLNDPNGLVFWKGNWHLFYQYTPTAIDARKKSWGHAVSSDLMTWIELPTAINAFFENGQEHNIFSGTGFVDKNDKSNLFHQPDGGVIFSFTCTDKGEFLAYAENEYLTDIKIMPGNPIITQNGRDPRIFFNKETDSWRILRYEEYENDSLGIREKVKLENVKKMFSFYKSKDLKNWEYLSSIENFYECPEMFTIEYHTTKKQIVMDASGKYLVGNYDGNQFISNGKPNNPVFRGNFYAMQHFENAPNHRIVIVGWIGQNTERMKDQNMSFSQAISIPMDLTLQRDDINNDYYLTALPSKEVYKKTKDLVYEKSFLEPINKRITINKVPTSSFIDINLSWNNSNYVEIKIGEALISFDKYNKTLSILQNSESEPQQYIIERINDKQLRLQLFIDRSIMGLFYDKGQTVIFKDLFLGKENTRMEITADGTTIQSIRIKKVESRFKV